MRKFLALKFHILYNSYIIMSGNFGELRNRHRHFNRINHQKFLAIKVCMFYNLFMATKKVAP